VSDPYSGRGNKDASVTRLDGDGTLKASPGTGGAMNTADAFLIGDTMTGGYGAGPDILHDCTVAVEPGEIAVIVGPNGAGKSTAMKAIFGLLDVRQGSVRLAGEEITALSPQDRVAKGMGFVPQTSNIFTSLSVEENLEMGAFIRADDYSETMAQVYELFPILKDKRRQPAGELSGGQRQQVAVGRALMTQPKVLMLDEPTAGVSPIVMDELFDRIIEVARTGIPILMVEQNARQALEIADTGSVLVQGRNPYTGTGKELLADPEGPPGSSGRWGVVLPGAAAAHCPLAGVGGPARAGLGAPLRCRLRGSARRQRARPKGARRQQGCQSPLQPTSRPQMRRPSGQRGRVQIPPRCRPRPQSTRRQTRTRAPTARARASLQC